MLSQHSLPFLTVQNRVHRVLPVLVIPPIISWRRLFCCLRRFFGLVLPSCVFPVGLPIFPTVAVTVLVVGDCSWAPHVPAIRALLLCGIVHIGPALAARGFMSFWWIWVAKGLPEALIYSIVLVALPSTVLVAVSLSWSFMAGGEKKKKNTDRRNKLVMTNITIKITDHKQRKL